MQGSEPVVRRDSRLFAELCSALLNDERPVRFRVHGESMRPNLLDGDNVVVAPAEARELRRGDIVLAENKDGLRVHRVDSIDATSGKVTLRSDTGRDADPPPTRILGRVQLLSRESQDRRLTAVQTRFIHPLRAFSRRVLAATSLRFSRLTQLLFGPAVLLVLGAALLVPTAHAQTDLAVTSDVGAPSVVAPGGQITYTVSVINNGPNAATTPVFSTFTPPNTTFVSAAKTGGSNGAWTCGTVPAVGGTGTISCQKNTNLASTNTAIFTIVVQVNAGTPAGTVVINSVNITSTTTDPETANNTASESVIVEPTGTADLQLTQTAAPAAVAAGTNYVYTETVVNNGPTAATANTITVSTQTPANTTYQASAGTSWTCGTHPAVGSTGSIVCTYSAALAVGGTANALTITVQVNAGTASGTVITNSATVSNSALTDPISSNNTSTTYVTVVATGTADLQLIQTASLSQVAASQNVVYTETVTNNGPTNAATGTISVYMQTPANTTYQASAGTNWTCGTTPAVGGTGPIVCTYGAALNAGSTNNALTVTLQVNAGTTAGTTIQSSATVTNSTLVDPIPSNNTSITSIVVEPSTSTDLGLSISVYPTPVFVSSAFTYTITVQNLGQLSAPVTANVLSDTLPAGVAYVSYSASSTDNSVWTCSNNTGVVSCSITSNPMIVGAVSTISINVSAPTGATTLTDTATLSLGGDPNSANNSATAYTVVQPISCASPGRDGAGGALTGIVNTYYPPSATGTLASGSTSVALGTAQGSATPPSIAVGDLLLIIQTQGASVNGTNTSSYGDGFPGDPGSGATSLGSSGLFEFITATSAVPLSGGTLTFTGTGPTGGLLNNYSNALPTYGSLGTAAAATWAGNVATFTFPSPLPASVLPYSVLTTTGFAPAGYNLSDAPILTVNPATGVITVALTTNPGAVTTRGTGVAYTQGQQTYQVIRVPQYNSATLTSGLVPLAWNGSLGGVLAVDVSSQLTLGGTVAVDALGFRGGGAQLLTGPSVGGTNAPTDYITGAPASNATTTGANASKGEGIAGTPRYVAPAAIALTTRPTDAYGGTLTDSLPGGSSARGAPGNAGGGATDGHPTANDQNSGGGGGGNGGTGGQGGYGWNSMAATNTTDGGFGGVAFPASTSALVMGGGGGAGTTNNGSYYIAPNDFHDCGANCTGIYSSGAPGGGIVIIHAGSVTGTGTITADGGSALSVGQDGGGAGGAGGSILIFANSGNLNGLTVTATGGNGGSTWPDTAPGTFPGQRHGPGGGGGGGVVFLTAMPTVAPNVTSGINGFSTTVQDSYGATPGQAGIVQTAHIITETPGTQSGAYCGSADLSVTNSAPAVVAPGGNIVYTQIVTNNGPLDAVNAVFSEAIPAGTTFVSVTAPTGWTCNTPSSTIPLSCTNPYFPASAPNNTGTFTVTLQALATDAYGTDIVDVDNITSSTFDPNLANNSATAITAVALATQADLAVTNTVTAPAVPTVTSGSTFTMTAVVSNNGPANASTVVFTENTASDSTGTVNATFVSISAPGWLCSTPAVGTSGTIGCRLASLNAGAAASAIAITETAPAGTPGTVLFGTASVGSLTLDPNNSNNSATASIEIAAANQSDLAVSSSGAPNPITAGNNITYTQSVTNNGPSAIDNTTGFVTLTFTDAIPANTTLAAAFAAPSGWTCNSIPVGGTGTFTCTYNSGAGQTINPGASFSFPLAVKVNAGTPGGTTITNSPGITTLTGISDPNLANNSVTVNTTVASPTQAFVTIAKSASPEPVDQNSNLTYTILVTNNGPAVAQTITVTDPIPTSAVAYASSSATQGGTCSYSAPTVTCNIPSLAVGSVAVITINVTAQVVGSSGVSCNGGTYNICNTATVATGTSNPNPTTTSSAGSTIQYPTAVDFASLSAFQQSDGTIRVVWHTLEESHNLGFHVYREDASGRHRIDASLIAGAALTLRGSLPQHAGKWYAWVDSRPVLNAAYWIEDVDVNGTRTMHGPAYPEISSSAENQPRGMSQAHEAIAASPSLKQLHANALVARSAARPLMMPLPHPIRPTPRPTPPPENVADHAAVKISVEQEGWYHLTFAQLFAAGLDPNTDVRLLHLYAEGVEQPLLLTGTSSIPAPSDAIEFYGTGIDTPFSGTRVYWLTRDNSLAKRILPALPASPSGAAPASFPFSVMREDRTTYFAALLNGENNDNFFGDVITSEPVDELLTVVHHDGSASEPLTLDITLQGGTDAQQHSVSVQFNGANVGTFELYGQVLASQSFTLDPSLLVDGANTVTLTALNGDNDVSLVQSIQLKYLHTYTADSDWLRATAPAGSEVQISGFTSSLVRIFDISDPLNIVELTGEVTASSGTYSISAPVPSGAPYTRTILAVAQDAVSAPLSLIHYTPAQLNEQSAGADIVIITHPDFASYLSPLVRLRSTQGYKVLQVTTDELFDQFNYGERSPFAIRAFLQNAVTTWRRKPQAVLLVGDASMDPRNYLGFGDFDFVPTRIIETAAFKTATDDWFTDFQQNGYATIPTGRLPVRTVADLELVLSKIVGYDQGQSTGTWKTQALFVADQNIAANFSTAATAAAATLPSSLQPTQILTDGMDPSTAHSQILTALNNGALLVDYNGHGAEQQWSFSNLFDTNDAAALTNGGRLPVYLLIDCLNGLFQDVYAESLAKSLLLAPNGGAVAVWASSGFTEQAPQASMDMALLHELSVHPNETLGMMVLHAKSVTGNNDVRRTWILFGDPAMRLPLSSISLRPNPPSPPPRKITPAPPRSCPRGMTCMLEKQQ